MEGLSSYYKNAPFSLNEGVSQNIMAQNYENLAGKSNNKGIAHHIRQTNILALEQSGHVTRLHEGKEN